MASKQCSHWAFLDKLTVSEHPMHGSICNSQTQTQHDGLVCLFVWRVTVSATMQQSKGALQGGLVIITAKYGTHAAIEEADAEARQRRHAEQQHSQQQQRQDLEHTEQPHQPPQQPSAAGNRIHVSA